MSAHQVEISEGVTGLCNTYEVDGRVSWHPAGARGFATANCYLVQEDDQALLIETGLRAHRQALLSQLEHTLAPDAELFVALIRQGEFESIGNLLPIVDRWGVKTVYGVFSDTLNWADYEPGYDVTDGPRLGGNEVDTVIFRQHQTLSLGRQGERRLEVVRPLLRLLNTRWVFDEPSGTLFTSDSFVYGVRAGEGGPWRITEADDEVDADQVRDQLLAQRFWWLAESDTDDVRRDLSDIFERYHVQHIAPTFGAIISGRSTVERHYELMDSTIAALGRTHEPAAVGR